MSWHCANCMHPTPDAGGHPWEPGADGAVPIRCTGCWRCDEQARQGDQSAEE